MFVHGVGAEAGVEEGEGRVDDRAAVAHLATALELEESKSTESAHAEDGVHELGLSCARREGEDDLGFCAREAEKAGIALHVLDSTTVTRSFSHAWYCSSWLWS